jgi:hypothetical protein
MMAGDGGRNLTGNRAACASTRTGLGRPRPACGGGGGISGEGGKRVGVEEGGGERGLEGRGKEKREGWRDGGEGGSRDGGAREGWELAGSRATGASTRTGLGRSATYRVVVREGSNENGGKRMGVGLVWV